VRHLHQSVFLLEEAAADMDVGDRALGRMLTGSFYITSVTPKTWFTQSQLAHSSRNSPTLYALIITFCETGKSRAPAVFTLTDIITLQNDASTGLEENCSVILPQQLAKTTTARQARYQNPRVC
jgi:hypothetical protein